VIFSPALNLQQGVGRQRRRLAGAPADQMLETLIAEDKRINALRQILNASADVVQVVMLRTRIRGCEYAIGADGDDLDSIHQLGGIEKQAFLSSGCAQQAAHVALRSAEQLVDADL
jgi:hypothetical protein